MKEVFYRGKRKRFLNTLAQKIKDDEGELTQKNMDFKESDEEYGCEVIGNIFDTPKLMED